MIFHAADYERLAIKMGQDSTEVMMRFLAQRPVAQGWAAVFGGENRVNQNLSERLWHGAECQKLAFETTLSGLDFCGP